MKPVRVAVVGSINMDLVIRTERVPRPGENLFGHDFRMVPGGKGANAAVACARLGAQAMLVGRVGQDLFGQDLLAGLVREGIDVSHVARDPGAATGVALIVVDAHGQNSILIATGANGRVGPADMDSLADEWGRLDAVLINFEVPLAAVESAIQQTRAHRVTTVVDAGPPRQWPGDIFAGVTILSPNADEAGALTGLQVSDPDSAVAAARTMLGWGVKAVVIKLGEQGALLADGSGHRYFPARKVKAVDTTAAGDAFTAALTVALAEGRSLAEAVDYANHAGALAVTRFGAQPSMPNRVELEAFIVTQKGDSGLGLGVHVSN